MSETQNDGVIRLTEPCWMCATHLGNGGYTPDCDSRCAYAYFKKAHGEALEGLRAISQRIQESTKLIEEHIALTNEATKLIKKLRR